jgi:hypothetical protein
MSTKTQYFCDKCGAESAYKLTAYHLQASGQRGEGQCSTEQELCSSCQASLLNALEMWGHPVHGRTRAIV